jgi:hypothetical protein
MSTDSQESPRRERRTFTARQKAVLVKGYRNQTTDHHL